MFCLLYFVIVFSKVGSMGIRNYYPVPVASLSLPPTSPQQFIQDDVYVEAFWKYLPNLNKIWSSLKGAKDALNSERSERLSLVKKPVFESLPKHILRFKRAESKRTPELGNGTEATLKQNPPPVASTSQRSIGTESVPSEPQLQVTEFQTTEKVSIKSKAMELTSTTTTVGWHTKYPQGTISEPYTKNALQTMVDTTTRRLKLPFIPVEEGSNITTKTPSTLIQPGTSSPVMTIRPITTQPTHRTSERSTHNSSADYNLIITPTSAKPSGKNTTSKVPSVTPSHSARTTELHSQSISTTNPNITSRLIKPPETSPYTVTPIQLNVSTSPLNVSIDPSKPTTLPGNIPKNNFTETPSIFLKTTPAQTTSTDRSSNPRQNLESFHKSNNKGSDQSLETTSSKSILHMGSNYSTPTSDITRKPGKTIKAIALPTTLSQTTPRNPSLTATIHNGASSVAGTPITSSPISNRKMNSINDANVDDPIEIDLEDEQTTFETTTAPVTLQEVTSIKSNSSQAQTTQMLRETTENKDNPTKLDLAEFDNIPTQSTTTLKMYNITPSSRMTPITSSTIPTTRNIYTYKSTLNIVNYGNQVGQPVEIDLEDEEPTTFISITTTIPLGRNNMKKNYIGSTLKAATTPMMPTFSILTTENTNHSAKLDLITSSTTIVNDPRMKVATPRYEFTSTMSPIPHPVVSSQSITTTPPVVEHKNYHKRHAELENAKTPTTSKRQERTTTTTAVPPSTMEYPMEVYNDPLEDFSEKSPYFYDDYQEYRNRGWVSQKA